MMRSLFAGVQGLKAHQTRMDVIGNNIANVNTTGFKAGRVNFADQYSQMLQGAGAPRGTRGGTNPKQVGLGVSVASIDTIWTEGSAQLTGRTTDLAISGNGFFVLREGTGFVYTRAGNFDMDAQGYLVNPATGQRVQGWLPNPQGQFPTLEVANLTDVRVPIGDNVIAQQTTMVKFDQFLNVLAQPITDPANPAVQLPNHTTTFSIFDSLGARHNITLQFFKNPADPLHWTVQAYQADGTQLQLTDPYNNNVQGLVATLEYNNDGTPVDTDPIPDNPVDVRIQIVDFDPGNGAATMNVDLDLSRVLQPAIPNSTQSTLQAYEYDGYGTGALVNISIDGNGVVTGYYDNGMSREVAQIAVAHFFNPGGLVRNANNNWIESPNSGFALIGSAGTAGRGAIASSTLEMSNVDLPAEFTNMIVTQRGFQANSRIITSTDEMLQEVVNLKR